MTGPDPLHHGWWLLSRSAGVVALIAVSVSVLLGLTMTTKVLARPKLTRTLRSLHEHAALAGLVAIGVHGVTLLGDPWLDPGLTGLLVPFAMDYEPLFTGLGIIGGLLAAVLGLSFYVRRRIGSRLWRRLHRWTAAVWLLGLVHTIGAGTDASTRWLQAILLLTATPIVVLLAIRLRPSSPAPVTGQAGSSGQRPVAS